jgi:DNA-binding ferritin-like protein
MHAWRFDLSNREDHEAVIRKMPRDITNISDGYKDLSMADFMIGVMDQHKKMFWMVRSYSL